MTSGRVFRAMLIFTLLVAALGHVASATWAHDNGVGEHGPDETEDPSPGVPYNGFKIYLSPAHHFGAVKEGCDAYTEEVSMRHLAEWVGYRAQQNQGALTDRGYKIRIGAGNPDENVPRSNSWNSDRYVALHSNARSNQQCGYNSGGTIGFYHGGRHLSQNLARDIKQDVAPDSPGSFYDDLRVETLAEVNNPGPDAPAVLIETEFHDWQAGQGWLTQHETWAWLIARAIDRHLGYP